MKSRILFAICFIAYHSIFSQTNTGISIQGIARNASKAALPDELLTFTFEIQEAGGGISYYNEDVDIRTDPYGVFSHIIGTGNVLAGSGNFNEIPFRQTPMKLTISVNYGGNDVEISNAPFQYAPYAISAENGVPSGTIVAFAGEEINIPLGWVLCDGRALNTIEGSINLINLIGPNVPDLRGMFLRGTGTSPVNSQNGPALRATQLDAIKSHSSNTATTSNDGAHVLTYTDKFHSDNAPGTSDSAAGGGDTGGGNASVDHDLAVGNHTHTVTVSYSGATETRPVNYGINYIIKL